MIVCSLNGTQPCKINSCRCNYETFIPKVWVVTGVGKPVGVVTVKGCELGDVLGEVESPVMGK